MTKTEDNVNVGGMYSKFWRITLLVISMLLIFAGPTYVPYLMSKVNIDYYATLGTGLTLFIAGMMFLLFLVKKKVVTI